MARAWRDQGDESARAKLIERNLGLVVAIARSLSNRGVPLEELIAEGNLGLVRAVDGFDPESGCRLGTYAFAYIRHAMIKLFAARSSRGRLKSGMRRLIGEWEAAVALLEASTGRPPRDEDVANHLGWPAAQAVKVRRARASTSQAAQRAALVAEAVSRQSEGPELGSQAQSEDRAEVSRKVRALLGVLSDRERQAIELTFGIGVPCRLSARGAAHVMKCSPRDVARLKTIAQLKLARQRFRLTAERPGSAGSASASNMRLHEELFMKT
ncbi:MAG: sigma-70 family RNA polymerase sigma factor [Planctomycetota bacterium]|nr:sigma-70 family RNA polymerase sigma factor [Planctomycetota bacterium]